MSWRPDQFRLAGGLNVEDPQFVLPSGAMTFCRNYDVLPGGGYRRSSGYDRYDGHVDTPSLASYKYLPFSNGGPRQILDGDLLTGLTSGATAHVVGTTELTSGAWNTFTAGGKIGITAITGTFVTGELVATGGIAVATLTATQQDPAIDDVSYKSWLAGARDYYRALIGKVPGGGPIRGVFFGTSGAIYAFRDDVPIGATICTMYKATSGGWTPVTLSSYIRYNTGTALVSAGDTITGGTSGATAVVRMVNIGAGNYAGPTYASGRFCIDTITGTFQNGEALKVGGVTKALAVGTQTVSSFAPSGRFTTLQHNFYGATNLNRVYGCDGVNRAWVFTETYFMFIETGMVTDTPKRIEEHREHLWLGFPGGSVQYSGTGDPLVWSPRVGAGELTTGAEITNLRSNGNNQLAITCDRSLSLLLGTEESDWTMRRITDDLGSVSWTMQEVAGQSLFLDRGGINVIQSPQVYGGDFSATAISRNVRKIIEANPTGAVDSIHDVRTGHYLIFYNDKTVLSTTYYGPKLQGFGMAKYAHQVTCSANGSDTAGTNQTIFGTDDGYVMMVIPDGGSYDGAPIESIMQLPYGYHKYPDRDKRFHKLTLEVDTPRAVDLRLLMDFDYGSGGQSGQFVTATSPTGGLWDVSHWEQFFWDSAVLSRPEINIDGIGINVGITLYHNDVVDAPFTVSAMLLQYTLLGIRR